MVGGGISLSDIKTNRTPRWNGQNVLRAILCAIRDELSPPLQDLPAPIRPLPIQAVPTPEIEARHDIVELDTPPPTAVDFLPSGQDAFS